MIKPLTILAIIVFALVVTGAAFVAYKQLTQTKSSEDSLGTSSSPPLPTSQEQGLGSLCSSEADCQQFCQNNRGRCESYCRGKTIELCRKLFSPESSLSQRSSPSRQQDCISNPSPLFTHSFTDIEKLSGISKKRCATAA
ncbi:hypothetical protein FJZ18_04355 [Candidatus Pacearchaeota archaeon]|nr:hypothetical protein [Candidatus Pacearchaeota archaeon]